MAERDARFDGEVLAAHLDAARAGDAHSILGLEPTISIRDALSEGVEWGQGSYERLLALYLAADTFGHASLNGVIYDFAEHTFFRYDDEGYALAQLNCDLAAIHATDKFGLFNEVRALEYFESALEGPFPEGVISELGVLLDGATYPLPKLQALRDAGSEEE